MKSPNIILIQADQMAAPALSMYGHAIVKTPHLEHLSARGTIFRNAYCNNPVCAPSPAMGPAPQQPTQPFKDVLK